MRAMGFTIPESANNYLRNSKHRMKAYELKLEKQAIENILNLPKLAKFRYKKFKKEVDI